MKVKVETEYFTNVSIYMRKRAYLIRLGIVLALFATLLTVFIVRVSNPKVIYETNPNFDWIPFRNSIPSIDPDTRAGIDIGYVVTDIEQAEEVFMEYYLSEIRAITKSINNEVHMKYDESRDAYLFYYDGGFLHLGSYFAMIFNNDDSLFVVKNKL